MKEKLLDNLEHVLTFVGILLLTFLISFLVNKFFKRQIRKSTEVMNTDPTNYQFLRHLVIALIYIVGTSIAIYTMPKLRLLATSLLAGAGVLAVAVGFASQHALSNIISGIFIVIFKPFRINDRLNVGGRMGMVEDISLRHTVIRDFENRRIIIPNSIISQEIITNSDYGDDKICKWIDIGISYDSDIELAKSIIKSEILNHPLHIDPRTEAKKNNGEELAPVKVVQLAESSVILRGWAWAKDSADSFKMGCDLFESIKLRFDKEGIEIPFPHKTIVHKERVTTKK
ncbi:mechanosensitive ion channel protein MscS [Flavivirga aquatica]|uniref:Mechanosensitive ion channel protein MscS n=1 Tax=Flavivirga aquatica TaxID=1849968 RepID=A0A1E5TC55_9FLAO|nr:mechanosensitive ion channel family protein [Flavivirga aquatica]OEK08951.1 mechanosensitive ion channel protein MscS [Flavivirga aquatica]